MDQQRIAFVQGILPQKQVKEDLSGTESQIGENIQPVMTPEWNVSQIQGDADTKKQHKGIVYEV